MIIVLKKEITKEEKGRILGKLRMEGYVFREISPGRGLIINAHGKAGQDADFLQELPGIVEVLSDTTPFKLVSREKHPKDTLVRVREVVIGSEQLVVIAGPCAIESREQALTIAREVKRYGAVLFRGGAFKPRSSPYSFQGLGEEGLKILAEVRNTTGLSVVSEITSPVHAAMMAKYVDMFQIGARNMQNFELLKCVGRSDKPVLLKRGLSATIEEWLMSAEYILSEGNDQVVLCERGIRTFEPYTRNTLDLSAIPVVKRITHLPIIIDPSHATGIREKVRPMARAAIAAGADGLMIEVHNEPHKALSDGPQSLFPEQFGELMRDIYVIAPVVGKQLDFAYLEKVKAVDQLSKRATTKTPTAAFLGEPGTSSHKACIQYFGIEITPVPATSFGKVFEAVKAEKVDFGIVPLHNSLTGSVHENYDLLLEYDLKIVGEITLRIEHNLIAQPGTGIADVKRVLSHPSVFQQCAQFLDQHKEWDLIATQDGATAAKRIKENGRSGDAVIASSEAAEIYGLEVLQKAIETNPRNYSRFVIVAPEQLAERPRRKSSLIYATNNRPGALYQTLKVFAEHEINLVKLESRPVDGKPWEYMFYVDLEADVESDHFKPVLQELQKHTDFIKILGSY